MTFVIVLGSGPAGMIAAHAARQAGSTVEIVSLGKKSHLNGAQYLHAPIPGLASGAARLVSYELDGTPQEYARKVYGSLWKGDVSPTTLERFHKAWDIRSAYDQMWDLSSSRVIAGTVTPDKLPGLIAHSDLVVSTVPARSLCAGGHYFDTQEIWAAGDAPGLGITVPYPVENETIICNGLESPTWYRKSRVFGHTTVEWPGSLAKPPMPSVARVEKPLSTNCNCWPDMLRSGRYGTWTKGVLAHSTYQQVYEFIK